MFHPNLAERRKFLVMLSVTDGSSEMKGSRHSGLSSCVLGEKHEILRLGILSQGLTQYVLLPEAPNNMSNHQYETSISPDLSSVLLFRLSQG